MPSSHYTRERDFWDQKGIDAYVSLSAFDQERILRWIARRPREQRCLDLGGGSGMTAKMLAGSGVAFLVCLDISGEMLKHSGRSRGTGRCTQTTLSSIVLSIS